jgi:C_GCAxxG_C_C family probable redox protein
MEFENKKEYAVYLKHNGFNCAQAVLMAYQDELGLDTDTIKKLGSAFGTGMGGMKGTCGALVGANIALGMLNTSEIASKFHAKDITDEFIELSGAITCQDLKGIKTHQVLCSCEDCIRHSIDLLDKKLETFSE